MARVSDCFSKEPMSDFVFFFEGLKVREDWLV